MIFSNFLTSTLQNCTSYDSYYYARQIMDKYLNVNLGINLEDLPDTCEIADIGENISLHIKGMKLGVINEQTAKDQIESILTVFNTEFLEFIIFG